MITKYKYIYFEELKSGLKTKQFRVRNKTSDSLLGWIKWYGAWRQYCFFVHFSDLVFSAGCLVDIQDFIKELTLERNKQDGSIKKLNVVES